MKEQSVSGKVCFIRPAKAGQFDLLCEGNVLMTGFKPKRLSAWALESGAKEVRFDFDLKLMEHT